MGSWGRLYASLSSEKLDSRSPRSPRAFPRGRSWEEETDSKMAGSVADDPWASEVSCAAPVAGFANSFSENGL